MCLHVPAQYRTARTASAPPRERKALRPSGPKLTALLGVAVAAVPMACGGHIKRRRLRAAQQARPVFRRSLPAQIHHALGLALAALDTAFAQDLDLGR